MNGILVNDVTKDLLVRHGHLATGDCRADIIERVLASWRGEFKELPTTGGEIKKMMSGSPDPFWQGDAKAQLKRVGAPVEYIKIDAQNNINIETV